MTKYRIRIATSSIPPSNHNSNNNKSLGVNSSHSLISVISHVWPPKSEPSIKSRSSTTKEPGHVSSHTIITFRFIAHGREHASSRKSQSQETYQKPLVTNLASYLHLYICSMPLASRSRMQSSNYKQMCFRTLSRWQSLPRAGWNRTIWILPCLSPATPSSDGIDGSGKGAESQSTWGTIWMHEYTTNLDFSVTKLNYYGSSAISTVARVSSGHCITRLSRFTQLMPYKKHLKILWKKYSRNPGMRLLFWPETSTSFQTMWSHPWVS